MESCDKDHEDDYEAPSLSDLPLNLIQEHNPHFNSQKPPAAADDDDGEFHFGSQPPPLMCLADEIFFQGQILPIRLSVSSAGLLRRHNRVGSGPESITHESLERFRSISSSRSHQSFSRVPNIFHSHPSPKPQIQLDFRRASHGGGRSQKSSAWEFFRLGLVRTPGMELHDLKHRNGTNRNSGGRSDGGRGSVGGRSSGGGVKNGILSAVGCKCSVETVPTAKMWGNIWVPAMKEMEMKMKKVEKEKEQRQKLATSRHRTFEWLKEVQHASFSFPCEA